MMNYAMVLENQEFDDFDKYQSDIIRDDLFLNAINKYESPKLKFCLGDVLKVHFDQVEKVK